MVDYGQPKLQKQLTHGLGNPNSYQQQAVTQQSQPTMPGPQQTAPASPQAQALGGSGAPKTGFDRFDPEMVSALASFLAEGRALANMVGYG